MNQLGDKSPGAVGAPAGTFDEMRTDDGQLRGGWHELAALGATPWDWAALQDEVDRRLADDNVTLRPWTTDAAGDDLHRLDDDGEVAAPQPWRLDPVPLVLHSREWHDLERGLVQRAEMMSALFADLYGERRLLADGVLPPEVVLGHPGYLRPLVGTSAAGDLFLVGATLGRGVDGAWRVVAHQAQAPVGAGYAMENRRVLSRVHAELYRDADLVRLTPFYQAMRAALVEAGPRDVEDPHVVVLTPGTHASTAFDQAFLASRLGFPLVEGRDLVVQDGRLWLRSLGRLEPVDVVFRHVSARATDPLELQPGSRLGVAGLTEVVRRGAVSVLNPLGSGVLENPALMAFDDRLCERLLDEPLRLPSLPSWWCGEDAARSHVTGQLDRLRVAHVGSGRVWEGDLLSAAKRDELRHRIEAEPHLYVGHEPMPLSTTPSVREGRLVPEHFHLNSFLIRHGSSYAALPGGLGEIRSETAAVAHAPSVLSGRPTKDLWIVAGDDLLEGSVAPDVVGEIIATTHAMVPRVLDDLYWLGRYAERAEGAVRLVTATQSVLVELNMAAGPPGSPVHVLLEALYAITGTRRPGEGTSALRQLRRLLVSRSQRGTVARTLARLSHAADGVRDQLSSDVWVVLAGAERALADLRRRPQDDSSALGDAAEGSLLGLLALTGITADNMVHDTGWQFLDTGRALERALQVIGLLRSCFTAPALAHGVTADADGRWSTPPDPMVLVAAMTAAESVVTHRRRHGGRPELSTVLDLLVADRTNPRSVVFQVHRIERALARLPHAPTSGRPQRLLADLAELTSLTAVQRVSYGEPALPHATDPASAVQVSAPRPNPVQTVQAYLDDLRSRFTRLSEALTEAYLTREPEPRPLWVAADLPPGPAGSGM